MTELTEPSFCALSVPAQVKSINVAAVVVGVEIPFANSPSTMLPVMRPAALLLALLPLSNSLLAAPARAHRSATPVLRRAVPVGVATLPDAAAPIAPGAALTTFLASASATTRSVHVLLCGRGRVDRQGGC